MFAIGLLFSALVVLLVTAFTTVWRLYTQLDEFCTAVLKMDVVGVERELRARVHGQEKAVQQVVALLKLASASPYQVHREPPPRHQLVFLLGGPGVGKSLLLDILKKHFKWQLFYSTRSDEFQLVKIYTRDTIERICTRLYTKNWSMLLGPELIITNILYNDQIHFEISLEDDSLAKILVNTEKKSDRSIHFVTFPIISESDLEEIQSEDEYTSLVAKTVDLLRAYMMRHAPELHVSLVTFKPLGPEEVKQYLREQQPSTEVEIPNLVSANITVNTSDPETHSSIGDVTLQDHKSQLLDDLHEEDQSLLEIQSLMEAETTVLRNRMHDTVQEECEAKILDLKNELIDLKERQACVEAQVERIAVTASCEHEAQRLQVQQASVEAAIAALVAANTRGLFVPRGCHIIQRQPSSD